MSAKTWKAMWHLEGPPTEYDFMTHWGATSLLQNATDFLNEGLQILFAKNKSESSWKLSIVAIQTSVELLAKYRLVDELGINSILVGGIDSAKLQAGNFQTTPYSKLIKKLEKVEEFSDYDLEIIRSVQQLRNKLVHFNVESTHDYRYAECFALLVRALFLFASRDIWTNGEMIDHTRFLTKGNYRNLVTNEAFRAEAVDFACDSYDVDKVLRCFNCGTDSFGFSGGWDIYYCYCCGVSVHSDVVDFAQCASCGMEDGVYFDLMNSDVNKFHLGKCGYCKEFQSVLNCPECSTVESFPQGAKPAACPECKS
ncbi:MULTISPECIES: hypothetical protein [Pseudomonas]|uniref:hypothetical protein n=1 Tax=Pseudomonas TaxID=286 RepID=UPI000FFB8CDB|nr:MULTISPECIES: hypothetical protein [Pseudomonas]MDZ3826562.1 hypothetical protein [Pseudomonas monsensis]